MISLSLVIPTINSSKYIAMNVAKAEKFLKECSFVGEYEIVVAAQTSRDDTFGVVNKIRSSTVIPLFFKTPGKGIGLTGGFKHAKYDWILMIDDDLPYSFESMEKLFHFVNDYDVIIASRSLQGTEHKIPFVRRVASAGYLMLVRMSLGLKERDIQAGMKLIKRELFSSVGYPKEKGYVWDTEMLMRVHKVGAKIIEVPVYCEHKQNELVVYKAAPRMALGLMRVWLRR